MHRSSNRRHERWYFTAKGNKREAFYYFYSKKMEEKVLNLLSVKEKQMASWNYRILIYVTF